LSAERLEDRCVPALNPLGVASALAGGAEHAAQEVTASYERVLGRAPDPIGDASAVSHVLQGALTPQQLDGQLAWSNEFIAKRGGLGPNWVTGLYTTLLNRLPEPGAVAAWEGQLAAGETPGQIADTLATGTERSTDIVGTEFRALLGRPPTATESADWTAQLTAGLDVRSLEASLVASPEYRGRFADDASWLRQAYQDILGRPPTAAEVGAWLATATAPGPLTGELASFSDVVQQQSPTCFFAASLAAVARSGVDLAARVTYLGNNTYVVPLFNPQVDAFNQVTGFGPVLNVQVYFDGSTDPATDLAVPADGSIWAVLYQRAYNQAFGQSPNGGSAAFAIMTLTGQANVNLPGADWAFGAKTPKAADAEQLASELAQGNAIVADTRSNGNYVLDPGTGLISSHSYTVVGADASSVILYNPWGVDTDWRLLDTNHDGFLSPAEAQHSPDGINGNFNDGLLRVTVAQFAALFNDVIVAT
jgi:hypothetical protein